MSVQTILKQKETTRDFRRLGTAAVGFSRNVKVARMRGIRLKEDEQEKSVAV